MNILITNDDGVNALGIKELANALKELGTIWVVAPVNEKSATGHGITVHDPIKVNKKEWFLPNIDVWAVGGTPADCVKLALSRLLPVKPDLVVSGINRGPNLGSDVLYSGTVSAAVESVLLGVPAIAMSLACYSYQDYSYAAEFCKKLCIDFISKKIAPDTLLNVNIPPIPINEIRGVRVTRLGEREYANLFEERKDPRGNIYFWMGGTPVETTETDLDLDVVAVKEKFVSVTPIHFDLTNYKIMEQIKDWNLTV